LGQPGGAETEQAGRWEIRGNSETTPIGKADGARRRGDPETYCRHGRKMRNPGMLGNSSSATTVARSSGDTRGSAAGIAEGCEIRGNSKIHRRHQPEDPGLGDARELIEGETGGAEFRGHPRFRSRTRRRMRDARKLEDALPAQPEDAGTGDARGLIIGAPGGARIRGHPEIHHQIRRKDARLEETRRSIAGTAGKMQDSGTPGDSSSAQLEEHEPGQPGAAAPKALRMRDSRKLDDPSPARPKD